MACNMMTSDVFWIKVEKELKQIIPNHVKFIFKLQSIDNAYIFSELKEDDLSSIEDFVRSEVYAKEIPENADLFQYYGTFGSTNFKFSENDLKIIKEIQEIIIMKGQDYWKTKTGEENPRELPESEPEKMEIEPTFRCEWESSTFMDMLNFSFKENSGREPRGHTFTESLKQVCSQLFIVGGRLNYDFLHANLSIPGPSTIERFIRNESKSILEGYFRVKELKLFLESRNLPKVVWLSEDQTGISGRIQYDSSTNQIVGLVLPLDSSAMPITKSFDATSAKAIEDFFRNNTSASFLYTFMAQPVDENAPTFCLMVFGSDNKMTYEEIAKRWKTMCNLLEANGIEVLGISGDGDSRILKTMRILSKLGQEQSQQSPEHSIKGFQAEILPRYSYVQDTVHIGNKLKNRLFKLSIILPMGNFAATCGDILTLVQVTTKDKHFLTETDLTLHERMNFASTMRICHPRIWKLLKDKIPDSDGTQLYLKIVFFSMQSMLSTRLNPLERLYAMWFGVFFIRIWRYWLSNNKFYSLVNNCISLNSYVCLELNAHALVNLILKCLKEGSFKHFLPWLYSSQACEQFFRNLRSTSSTFSTVVNCSVLDAIHRLKKLQLLTELSVHDFEKAGQNIHFPRSRFLNATHEKQEKDHPEMIKINTTVSEDSIKDVLMKAKSDAWEEAKRLGMDVSIIAADNIQIKFHGAALENFCDIIEEEDIQRDEIFEEHDEIDPEDEDIEVLTDPSNHLEFSEFPDNVETLTSESSKTVLKDRNGKLHVVKKSTLCWYFSNYNKKISSDRNIRVKECGVNSFEKQLCRAEVTETSKQNQIHIRDFCLFQIENSDKCLIGLVSGFAYMEEKNWKNLAYAKSYVDFETDHKKTIGVFARWFTINPSDKTLITYSLECQGYVNVNQYRLTIPAPVNVNEKFVISDIVFNDIKTLLLM